MHVAGPAISCGAMGLMQIAMTKRLALEWPSLVRRAGGAIRSVWPEGTYGVRAAGEGGDLARFVGGPDDYYADVVCDSVVTTLWFGDLGNLPQDYGGDCVVFTHGRGARNFRLGASFNYLFLASGGVIVSGSHDQFRRAVIVRTTPDAVHRAVASLASDGWNVVSMWHAVAEPDVVPATTFQLLTAGQCGCDVELWLGPALPDADGRDAYAVLHTRPRWLGWGAAAGRFDRVVAAFEQAGSVRE